MERIEVSGQFLTDAGYVDPWSVKRLHLPDGRIIDVIQSRWNGGENKLIVDKWRPVEIVVTSVSDLLSER